MSSIDLVRVNDTVSFTVYGSSGISAVTNGKVVNILSGEYLTDRAIAASNHTNIYPDIPQTSSYTVEDVFTSYSYLTIETIVDSESVLTEIGIPWIIPASFVIADRGIALVTINNFDQTDLGKLSEVLRLYGFANHSVVIN